MLCSTICSLAVAPVFPTTTFWYNAAVTNNYPISIQVGATGVYLLSSYNYLTKWASNGQYVWSYSLNPSMMPHSLKLSPDETYLILVNMDSTVSLDAGITKLNSSTGSKIYEFYIPNPRLQEAVSISPDSQTVLVSGSNTSALWHIFNSSTGSDIKSYFVTSGNTSQEFAYDSFFINNTNYILLITSD